MRAVQTTTSPECRDGARELLDFYLNGSLSGDEEAAVESHLDVCQSCSEALAQISDIAAAIERHGVEPQPLPSTARRVIRGTGLAAAAVIVVASAALFWNLRSGDVEAPVAEDSSAVRLDLGAGSTRDGSGPPTASLTSATRSLVVTFFVPARPNATYAVTVLDAAGGTRLPEAPVAALDGIGRATLSIPAASLQPSGSYFVTLRVVAPDGEERSYSYPFDVSYLQSPAATNAPQK